MKIELKDCFFNSIFGLNGLKIFFLIDIVPILILHCLMTIDVDFNECN